jgi:gamma-glutamylcyclotransferase (GGCT)/AIG2-like uncharacterized protein YtfP
MMASVGKRWLPTNIIEIIRQFPMEEQMHQMFAFGSNMSLNQMHSRCPGARAMGKATLEGYVLDFPRLGKKRRCGVASISQSSGGVVEGVIYEISDEELAKLDWFEGVGVSAYRREMVPVQLFDGTPIDVWAYFANPQDGGPFLPSREYLDTIVEGAIEHGLSAGYVERLKAITISQ